MPISDLCRAGHFRYFFTFDHQMIFLHFFQVNNLLLHQSYLKSPLPVKLTWWNMQKTHFLLLKKLKTTSSAHLWLKFRHEQHQLSRPGPAVLRHVHRHQGPLPRVGRGRAKVVFSLSFFGRRRLLFWEDDVYIFGMENEQKHQIKKRSSFRSLFGVGLRAYSLQILFIV